MNSGTVRPPFLGHFPAVALFYDGIVPEMEDLVRDIDAITELSSLARKAVRAVHVAQTRPLVPLVPFPVEGGY